MANIKTQLDILKNALLLKEEVLNKIYRLTNQQAANSSSTTSIADESLLRSNEELTKQKQALIERLQPLDNGFQLTYERIRATLNQNKELYHVEVSNLQKRIQQIGELDIAIRVLEKKNEATLLRTAQFPKKKGVGKPIPKQVTAAYSNGKKKTE